jgi:antitoxin ParD1/3/4
MMATMNVSLPEPMRDWINEEVASGRFASVSDLVRDVVRERIEQRERIARLNELLEEGINSGIDPRSVDEIFADIRSRIPRNG